MNTMKTTTSRISRTTISLALFLILTGAASAVPDVKGVSTDPAHITAGDEVDISVNLEETDYPDKTWDAEKELKARLEADNRLAREHSIIVEDMDRSIGFLYPDGVWNQEYRVKFNGDAPTGTYEYRVDIQYLENGEPVEIPTGDGTTLTYTEKFTVTVDKEGVDLSASVTETDPSNLRPGYNYADTRIAITNTGNKPIENIVMQPETPEKISPAFSRDEKFVISKLNQGASQQIDFSLDLEEEIEPGRHVVNLSTVYEDTDSNDYTETLEVPIRIEGKPDLELESAENKMQAGGSGQVMLSITNEGSHTAEGVTARMLLEREQPFSLETRSDYIGNIEPGETREAAIKVSADRSAVLKEHQLKIQMRATGDSDEGDNSVYTFTDHQTVELEGRTTSNLVYLGILGAIAVLAGLVYYRKRGKTEEE